MTLDEALKGVIKLAIDTAPLIYLIERHPAYLTLMREIIKRVDSGDVKAVSSVVTLTEILTHPLKRGDMELAEKYRELLLHSRNFSLVSITPEVAETAARLRARYNLRTPDALQIAVALQQGCDAFLTNDAALKRVTEIKVLVLSEIDIG